MSIVSSPCQTSITEQDLHVLEPRVLTSYLEVVSISCRILSDHMGNIIGAVKTAVILDEVLLVVNFFRSAKGVAESAGACLRHSLGRHLVFEGGEEVSGRID